MVIDKKCRLNGVFLKIIVWLWGRGYSPLSTTPGYPAVSRIQFWMGTLIYFASRFAVSGIGLGASINSSPIAGFPIPNLITHYRDPFYQLLETSQRRSYSHTSSRIPREMCNYKSLFTTTAASCSVLIHLLLFIWSKV